jgi:hypothetical protein
MRADKIGKEAPSQKRLSRYRRLRMYLTLLKWLSQVTSNATIVL